MSERLQKIISGAGYASRRKAEELIRAGLVRVNGETAALGQSADPELDEITVDGIRINMPARRRYIMLNKPRGYVTTLSDEQGRPTVAELIRDAGGRLYPVGRLDMYSEGLLILTDDGAAANRLMHPSHQVKKTYHVWVQGDKIPASLKILRSPMEIDGYPIRPAQVSVLESTDRSALLEMKISEGRNRQIRKMCGVAGLKVHRLVRVSEGELRLGDLPVGKWRNLTPEECAYIGGLE